MEPCEHWASLLCLADDHGTVTFSERRKNGLMVVLGRFLRSYDLGDKDHLDVGFGIYRTLAPCIEAIDERLRSER